MAKTIARITGTAIRPGISRNGRLYTKEMIKSAVDRAQSRLADGTAPMTMLTHHLAGDDSTQIVGQVDKWSVDADGNATYEAALADTPHARTVASLVDPNDGAPFLKGVSIRGGWLGSVKYKRVNGQLAEYGEDLELDGLDFTKSPGVLGAQVDSLTYTDTAANESDRRVPIYETVTEANVQITEDAPAEVKEKAAALKSGNAATPQTKATNYADPGYQPDKMKRYALDTKSQAMAAWSYINQAKNAKNYTAPQLKQIKQRITKALRKFGVKVDNKEGWVIAPAVEVTEGMGDIWPDVPGSFEVRISNGMVNICVSSWSVNPADLELCARAAMDGACKALIAIDPDTDGDIDTGGENDADNMESAPDPLSERPMHRDLPRTRAQKMRRRPPWPISQLPRRPTRRSPLHPPRTRLQLRPWPRRESR